MTALFAMHGKHQGPGAMHQRVQARVEDMNDHIDADALRRQANTVARLAALTIFGLVATVAHRRRAGGPGSRWCWARRSR